MTQVSCQKDQSSSKKGITFFFLLSPTEPCSLNFTDPEGNIKILQQLDSGTECNYLVTVYLGYGIEVQVSAIFTPSIELKVEKLLRSKECSDSCSNMFTGYLLILFRFIDGQLVYSGFFGDPLLRKTAACI